jgi:ATPase subunit of ABC transporter with duplicated ATPase domains
MLVVHHLSKSYGIKPVLFDVSFTLNAGEKAALVGPNGCGKSTLLRLLAGEASPDRGSINFNPPALNRAFLPQGGVFLSGETVGDFIRRVEGNQDGLTARLETLADRLVYDPENIQLQQEYDETLRQLDYALSTGSSAAIFSSFRLDNLPPDLPLHALSGGQKTRLGLAGILLSNPHLLLLDEPTNHLDFEMLDWLESWLKNSRCTILLVSHDRDFLDHIAETILELDPSRIKPRLTWATIVIISNKKKPNSLVNGRITTTSRHKFANSPRLPAMYATWQPLQKMAKRIRLINLPGVFLPTAGWLPLNVPRTLNQELKN